MIIDGRRITPQAGASVLETAREVGSAIPTLCHHPGLPPDGSCRMCLVEVDGRSLHPACVLPATDDLVVRTETDDIQAERRSLLRLLLGKYRPGIGRADNGLLVLADRYGVDPSNEKSVLSWRSMSRIRLSAWIATRVSIAGVASAPATG